MYKKIKYAFNNKTHCPIKPMNSVIIPMIKINNSFYAVVNII